MRIDRPGQVADVSFLLRTRALTTLFLALTSMTAGLAEAAFLVILTRVALAVAAGEKTVGLWSGHYSIALAVAIGAAALVARLLAATSSVRTSAQVSNGVISDIRKRLARAYLRADWALKSDESKGSLQELMTTFVNTGGTLMLSLTAGVSASFSLLALLVVSFILDPATSLLVIASMIALGVILRPLRRRLTAVSARAASQGMGFATSVSEITSLSLEIEVFGVREQVNERIERQISSLEKTNRRLTSLRGFMPVAYTTLAYTVLAGAIFLASTSTGAGLERVGTIILVMLRALSYGQALQVASSGVVSSAPFVQALRRRIEEYEEARSNASEGVDGRIESIQFEDVSFTYPGSSVAALHRVSFSATPGRLIGISGPSGSGKSTLVQLLLGLRSRSEGVIRVNGRVVSLESALGWRFRVGLVPQSTTLLTGSIRDNVAFFRDISDEEVDQAIRRAGLTAELESWPDGVHHQVGEAGGSLSGGQRQRLSIARCLAGNPDVLVLDEPTSALDAASESIVQSTLRELAADMICFVVSHRETTLKGCGEILEVRAGRLSVLSNRSTTTED